MSRPELGNKLICPTTGRKFYDLGRSPVVSPYSGEIVPLAVAAPRGRYAAPVAARREEPAVEEEEAQEGPELVSLDEVEEGDKDLDTDAEGDDTLALDDDGDDAGADDERFVVEDEDEES